MMRAAIMSLALLGVGQIAIAQTGTPVVTDSRIKTLVYNENDVYSLLTHYGYQSNIEFGRHETVQTVSVGDRIAWQIIPAGRRLFIKAMEESAHTNMTVITNKRAYQFDLRSSGRTPLHPSEELVYVVRFFYPQEQERTPNPPVYSDQVTSVAAPVSPPQTNAIMSGQAQAQNVSAPGASQPLNYHYTLSGPDAIAPVRIYDDGRATYFMFESADPASLQFFAIGPDGRLQPLPARSTASGELMVPTVQPQMVIQRGGQQVTIYNESIPTA